MGDAARLVGIEELDPVPLRLWEEELIVDGCGGLRERLLAAGFEAKPLGGDSGSLNILLYRVSVREALRLARSIALGYALLEGLGCKPLRPTLVVLDREPPLGAEPLVAAALGLRGYWLGVYRLWRLGYALGERLDVQLGDPLLLECGGCGREACRALASLLDSMGILAGVSIDGRCIDPRDFVDSGVEREASCPEARRAACREDGDYITMDDCLLEQRLYARLMGCGEEVLTDASKLAAKTGLDACSAARVLAFKRLADLLLARRIV